MMKSSLGRKEKEGKEEEFTVEQVEAVIATLNDKVARLQKDIGTLKQTDGSHRRVMPTNLTYARNVADKRIRLDEKKVAKGKRRESKSFSHDKADPSESLSCRVATSINASTSMTKTTTTMQQQQQRKHALFNGQRKNRPQPQEVNNQVDDRQNTLYPNASDFALNTTPPPERDKSSGSKAQRNEREYGARSIDNNKEQQSDRGAIPRNMDEQQRRASVSWRGIDNNELQQQQQQHSGDLGDARRYDGVDERNRPPIVKPVTTPHRRSSLNEPTNLPKDQLTLDRDSGKLATGAPKSTDEKFIKHAGQDKGKKAEETSKKTSKGKAKDQKTVDNHAPKVIRSIMKDKKTEDSNTANDKSKSFKLNKKDKVSKEDTIKNSEKPSKIINLSKIAKKSKNTSDKNKSASAVPKQAFKTKSGNFSKKIFSKKKQSIPPKNDKNHAKSQKIKNNSKSNDSMKPKHISIKNKLSECTKEINQLIGKVSDLFRKKSKKNI